MKKYLYVLLLFLSFGCQKQIEIPFPNFYSKPVVNCLFTTKNNMQLQLSKTRNLNDSIISTINNAKCYVFLDKQCIDTMMFLSNGIYYSTIIPQENEKYFLKIKLKNEEEINSSTQVPQQPQIENIEQKDFDFVDNTNIFDGDIKLPLSRFSFTVLDKGNEKNYYELKIWLKHGFSDTVYENNYLMSSTLFSYDKVIQNEDILDYSPKIIVFSDSLFNGKNQIINVLYKPSWISVSEDQEGKEYSYGEYRLIYVFRAISKEMYLYRKSLIKHLYNQQTPDIEHIGDPVQLYSNIENGYGIFGAYVEICDTLNIEESNFRF